MSEPHIHPRLRSRAQDLGALLQVEDATELNAALDDIQTLLYRCRYHLDLARAQRGWYRQRRQHRAVQRPTGAQRRGRRPGSANWAQRQLGLGLAQIWAEQSGRAPTRRYDAYGTGLEHGPFRDFVICVVSALPPSLRATRKGHTPQVDYLVRAGIEEFKAAQRSGDEARGRGVLVAERWMSALAPEGDAVTS